MPRKSFHKRNAINNQSLAETSIRDCLAREEQSRCHTGQVKADNKRLGEERRAASEALVGKKVIVAGQVGRAHRIDAKSGSIIIKTPFGEKLYDPAGVSVV